MFLFYWSVNPFWPRFVSLYPYWLHRTQRCLIKMFTKFRGAIHSTKISGNFGPKLSGSVRSSRKGFEKTGPPFEVVLFSRSDRSEFWLVLVKWIAPQMTSRISAVQEHTSDMRSAVSAPVQVCPTNLKEPYKIGQATDQSKKMREPPQQVKQRSTKQFPPMTSNYGDFQTEQFMKFPEALLHYSKNSCPKRGLTLIHALHSAVSTVQGKIQRVPFRFVKQPPSHPRNFILA